MKNGSGIIKSLKIPDNWKTNDICTMIYGSVTQVNDQKTASSFATDSYRFWGAESRKNSQNVPSRHVFLQNLISYPYKECSDNFF